MFEHRKYLIFSVDEIDKVDFSMIYETSAETLRTSIDGTKTFIKWDEFPFDPTPYESINNETGETITITPTPPEPLPFLVDITSAEGPYSHEEMIEILGSPEWSDFTQE